MMFYAHSVEGKPVSEWQLLDEHLTNVAKLARSFAEEFGAGEWAYLAGLWHVLRFRVIGDLGKYSEEFHERLGDVDGCNTHIRHNRTG